MEHEAYLVLSLLFETISVAVITPRRITLWIAAILIGCCSFTAKDSAKPAQFEGSWMEGITNKISNLCLAILRDTHGIDKYQERVVLDVRKKQTNTRNCMHIPLW